MTLTQLVAAILNFDTVTGVANVAIVLRLDDPVRARVAFKTGGVVPPGMRHSIYGEGTNPVEALTNALAILEANWSKCNECGIYKVDGK